MTKFLIMPKIGMNMIEGVITRWLISPGDRVEKEQVILESETDKAIQEIVATESGIVHKLLVSEGEVVPCQTKIAILTDENEELSTQSNLGPSTRILEHEPDQEPENADDPDARPILTKGHDILQSGEERIKISPLARKTASVLGIDLRELTPKKEGLRITKPDVERYYHSIIGTSGSVDLQSDDCLSSEFHSIDNREKFDHGLDRRVITFHGTVDSEELYSLWENLEKKFEISFDALIMKICAVELKKNPLINSIFEGGDARPVEDINIRIALPTENGISSPVIHHVDKKRIQELSDELRELNGKALSNQLTRQDLSQGTFSIINLGNFSVESFNPVMFDKECAILGIGMTTECPVVYKGEITKRKCMEISLSFKVVAVDEMTAARFFKGLKAVLEYPLFMLE